MSRRIQSPELTVQHLHRDKSTGPGLYGAQARQEGVRTRFSHEAWVTDLLAKLQDGQRFRLVIELADEPEWKPVDTVVHSGSEMAICQACGWEGAALGMTDADRCPSCRQDQLMFRTRVCTCRETMGERFELHCR